MPATGNNTDHNIQQSIRIVADGLSFYPGPEAIVVCSPSTRVPMADFRREEADTLLSYVCPPDDEPRTVLYNVLPELEVVEIFCIHTQLLKELRERYPMHRILGVNAMVLETMWRHDRNLGTGTRRLYCYCHEDEMLVFAYSPTGLLWANTFQPSNADEQQYFTLMAWRQLGMDAERDECLLLGAEGLAEGLRPYLRHVAELTAADVLGKGRAESGAPFDILVI